MRLEELDLAISIKLLLLSIILEGHFKAHAGGICGGN